MAKKNLPYPAEKIGELLIEVDNEVAKKSDLNDFVKKESGRGLSTNDYTTAEKAKLAGIQEGAQKNTVTSVRGALQLNPQVGNVVISAADIGLGNANTRLTALENNKLNKSEKGATNGVASLDENGRVPSSQLPSYVDDVIEVANYESLPTSGESGKIYITQSDNKTYRWSGNDYAEISASLALGETEQTAYSGAKGKKNADDIAKLAKDLDETHQLASNAESAISEVVELTIPAIESEVANKATKSEAQGYATTAKNEAITAAATDAQNKANTAESNANDYTDGAVDDLAKGQVATNKANIASLQTAQTSLSATVKTNTDNITTHTQQITNLDSNKLGKTEKAADSAKADSAAALSVKDTTVTSVTNAALTYHIVSAANVGSLPYGDNANAVITIPSLAGNLKYLHQIGFTGKGLFWRKMYNKDVDTTTLWSQIAFTDSTVANAEKLGGVAAADYMQKSGGTFTADITAPKFIGALQGNADSATKLATARTIWGQSFDGSGDLDGQPTINASLLLRATGADAWRVIRFMQTAGNTNAGEILFQAGVDRNGVKIVSEYGDWAHRQNLVIYTSNNTVSPYAPVWVAALMVKHNGNVGIGTTAPTEKLEVSGNAKIAGQLSTDSYIVSTGAIIGGGDNVCQISNNVATVEMRVTAAGSARLMRWKDGAGKNIIESDGIKTTLQTGNVGIGTTSPSEKLDVVGNIKSSGNVTSKGLRVEGDVVITGNVVIEGSVTSGASYQSNPLSTISEDEVPSVEQQLRSQISSLEERIATLEQIIAQNNG